MPSSTLICSVMSTIAGPGGGGGTGSPVGAIPNCSN